MKTTIILLNGIQLILFIDHLYRPINVGSSRSKLRYTICCIPIHIRFQFVVSWLIRETQESQISLIF